MDPVAIADIEAPGTPGRGIYAFRVGHVVPADLVKKHGWEDLVASRTSKAAQAATSGEPVSAEKGGK